MSVVIAPTDKNLLRYVNYEIILEKDHQEETYEGKERYLTNRRAYNPEEMGKVFYIGDNKTDLYKYGKDNTDNSIHKIW